MPAVISILSQIDFKNTDTLLFLAVILAIFLVVFFVIIAILRRLLRALKRLFVRKEAPSNVYRAQAKEEVKEVPNMVVPKAVESVGVEKSDFKTLESVVVKPAESGMPPTPERFGKSVPEEIKTPVPESFSQSVEIPHSAQANADSSIFGGNAEVSKIKLEHEMRNDSKIWRPPGRLG